MNIERLVCVGVSHQTAPVALREQLSTWPQVDLRMAGIEELVILCTCNRLELYAYVAEQPTYTSVALYQPLVDLITKTQGVESAEVAAHLYHLEGEAVTRHLCRVAAGLESLVMGEGQILGQVNSALQQAYRLKTVGPQLALLFRTAIKAGKRARTETKINVNPVSISSAAIALAAQVTGDLRRQHVAVVGLGEIGQLALKGLRGRGVTALSLVNRTPTRAQDLANVYGGQPFALADLAAVLQHADIVITATSATEPLLRRAQVAAAVAQRAGRPLTFIDLAVPRDVEPSVATLPTVTLFDVDDMHTVVDDALAARQAELPHVEAIIDELLVEWRQQIQELRLRPVVVGLRQKAEQIRRQALVRTVRHLERQQGELDEQTAAQLAHLSRALVNQLLHIPTAKLKQKAGEPDGAVYAALVCELFGLDIPFSDDDDMGIVAAAVPDGYLGWISDGTADLFVDECGTCPTDAEEPDPKQTATAYSLPIHTAKAPQYELVGQP